MIIGHHLLTGKVTKLEKPFAVISKGSDCAHPAVDAMETDTSHPGDTEYTVVAMIRKKVVFKVRPKPIVANSFSRTV